MNCLTLSARRSVGTPIGNSPILSANPPCSRNRYSTQALCALLAGNEKTVAVSPKSTTKLQKTQPLATYNWQVFSTGKSFFAALSTVRQPQYLFSIRPGE